MPNTRKDKTAIFRLDATIYEHLQELAAELGLNLSEYLRIMACWPFPHLLIAEDALKILRRGEEKPEEIPLLLRSALARLEAGEGELEALLEKIEVMLPKTQAKSREGVAELKAMLQERLSEVGAWGAAFKTLRKRLEERQAAGQEGQ
jgi:predicted DNA-binding protein